MGIRRRITLEHAEVHEPLVLDALPAPEGQRELRHGLTVAGPGTVVNVVRAITGDTALRLGHSFGASPQFWLNPTLARRKAREERQPASA